MTAKTFNRGDLVAVLTKDRGERHLRKHAEETWAARVIGPSVIGDGWWLVRKVDPATGRPGKGAGTFTVPEHEMSRP